MASIFDSLADTTEAPPKAKGTGSIFDDLGEPEAKPAAAPAGEIPRGSLYTAPAAVPQAPPLTAGRVAGKVGEAAVDLVDMAISGVPAMLLGTIGEVTQRLGSLVDGRGYREGAKAGAEFSRSMGERFGRPLYDNLKAAGVLKGTETSLPQQAMEKIGGWLEHAATVVEHDSKGVISKEDYLASVNGFMAAMGVKGLKAITQGALNKAEARGTKNAWDSALERFDAEEQLARAKFEEGSPNRTAAKAAAERPADDGLYGGDFAAQAAARREAFLRRKAYEKGVANFPPSGERTGSRGPVDLTLEGKETPTTYSGNQPFSTADQTAGLKRGVVSPSPIETEGALRPAVRPALDSGLEKVKGGRLFDMTMEERLAVRNSVDITDPKVITAAAVGATGLGLAMMYEPSAEEAAMAIGAGALLRRGGEGMPMRELLAKPEATPLGALLESSAYTTSTLEKLADSSPGKFEFKKTAIEQLLKREGVTKHERDLMVAAMAEVPRDTVTAKELMVGLKLAAKDFELTPAKSDSYANYGLERIDRDPGIRRDLAQQFGVEPETNPLEATTRIYRSPLELGSNNHFQDPNYFAHTRSFVEDGVRHVVELQSDLAQKAGKVLSPEERAKLLSERDGAQAKIEELLSSTNPDRAASLAEVRRLRTVQAEANSKLATAGTGAPVAPMLKDWHKRLVREELADAARNLEGSVRFATADTVAKVEGWPEALRREVDQNVVDLRSELARVKELGYTAGEGWFDQVQAALVKAEEAQAKAPPAPRFRPEHQGIYDRYSRDVEKFLRQLGAQPVTDSAGHTWLEVPLGEQQKALPGGGARTQLGRSDRAVLGSLAAMGASAALASWLTDPERDRNGKTSATPKIRNALLAAAGTAALSLLALKRSSTPAVAQKASGILRDIEDFAGNTSYQIEKLSPPVLRAVDNYKMGQLVRTQDYLHTATPFAELLRRASPTAGKALDAALLTGDWPTAIKSLGDLGVRGAVAELTKVRTLLADVGKDLLASGAVRGLVDNYYPRVVADLDGLLGAMGKPAREFFENAVEQATRKAGRPLDNIELSQVVNKALEASLFKRGGDGSGFRAGRTIPEVTADLARFYAPASESLVMYLDWAAKAIERAKFFGKHAVREEGTGKLDLDSSIGNVMYALDKKKALSRVDRMELQRLLGVEFTYANQFGSGFLQSWNRLTSASLIANAGSALMNLGDTGQAINMHGLSATVKAIQQTLGRSDGRVTRHMMGLADTIANEFTGADKAPIIVNIPGYGGVRLSTAKFLDGALKWSGFRALDSFGKQVLSNAAVNSARAQVATPTGLAKFAKSHAAYFGDDLPTLIDDLKSRQITPLTLEYTWRKLSDAQPLTSADMPTARTANPNARFLWSLKSYMIKQLTLMRKEGIDKLRRGDSDGARFLLRYALLVGGGQAGMEWIVNSMWGKNDELTWGDIPVNVLKNFGISQYAIEKFRKGEPVAGASALVAPPLLVLTEVLSGKPEAVQRIPVVGKPIYMRLMGGAEKANEKEAKKKRAEERQRLKDY